MTARCAAAATALVAALASGLVAVPAAPASAAVAAGLAAQLTVAPRNAGVLQSGRPLVVDVAVRNTGTAALPAGELAFSLDQAPAASAAELLSGEASIADPSQVLLGRLALTRVDVPALVPGTTATVTARITADDLTSILTPANGARRLFVRLQTDTGGLQTVAESAVVRMGSNAPRIGFGTVVPLTAPAGSTGVVDVDAQADLTEEDGEWTQAVEAARAMPSAVLALDPAVIASVRLAGTAAPESAQQFLTDLAELPNTVVPLPYADGDAALQRAAGLTGSTAPESFAGATTEPAPASTATPAPAATPAAVASAADLTDWDWSADPLLWPVPGTATSSLLSGRSGSVPALLSASDVQDTAARVAGGPLAAVDGTRVLIADAAASRLLADATTDDIAGRAALAPLAAALATDAVTASTPSVLAVAGRGASAEGLARVLGVLQSQQWIRGDALTSMTGREAVAVRLRPRTLPSERVARAQSLIEGERRVQRLATAVQDPQQVAAAPRLSLLGLLSARWRGQDDAWSAATTTAAAAFDGITDQVSIVDPGPTTLTGSDAGLQVSVQNGLPQSVTLLVTAKTDNNRLRFTDSAPMRITVPAQTVGRTALRLQTVANGSTRVTLSLTTPDGAAIGASTSRAVTVQAGFDTIVAVVLLTLLGALLALGVYRNIARRRRPKAER